MNEQSTQVLEIHAGEISDAFHAVDGGKLRNVIPYHAEALLFVPQSVVEEAQHLVSEMHDVVRRELGSVEPNVSITSAVAHVRQQGSRDERPDVFTSPLQRRVTSVISALPHGIIRLSPEIPGLVETSTNVAVVETAADRVTLATSQRSSIASASLLPRRRSPRFPVPPP